jgi:hypothetical protein
MRRLRNRGTHAALIIAALALVAACSSDDSDGGSGGDSLDADTSAEAPRSDFEEANTAKDGTDAGRVEVQTRAVISTGSVTVVDEDLARVRGEIDRLLGRYGGYVADEATFNDVDGHTSGSRLTLRVPASHFTDMMAAFPEFTTVKDTKTSAEDVTTEVIDVDSRVKTQELSLERLRTFLSRTQDVNAMIRLESEIAQREAQLESLKAQQKYLADQTSLGTITVSMKTPKQAKHDEDDSGFLAGFEGGWNALQDSLTVTATVVGALLPFAAVVALVGVPLWLVARRRRPAQPPVVEQ